MAELYYTRADALARDFDRAFALLTPGRKAATLRLQHPQDRYNSAAAGLLLRRVLGVVSDAQLAYSDTGKPELPGGRQFSLSHGGTLCVLAVDGDAVGVDVEPLSRAVSPRLYEKVLQPDELIWLQADSRHCFYQLWTRKESVMKACGLGIGIRATDLGVLADTAILQERIYHLCSWELDGHAVSLSTATAASVTPVFLPAEGLLV